MLPALYSAVSSIGAGIICYALWISYANWYRKRSFWKYIFDVRQREDEIRDEMHIALDDNSKLWIEIVNLPIAELIRRLQCGELKAVDALAAYQYAALDGTEKSNAVTEFVQNATEIAQELDDSSVKRPLHGVPFSMKETFLLQGTEATAGLAFYLGKYKNKGTMKMVQFLIDQGCIPFIRTNVPQAALSTDSRNAIYGITRNPNDVTRSPGGSSSGEAAIISQHGSPIGIGTDIGGSLRIPVSWCGGCVTLKPTSQRVDVELRGPDGFSGVIANDLLTFGFITRDVATLATLHRLYYSAENFKKLPCLVPLPFREEIYNSSVPLTIGYYTNLPGTVESVPAVRRAVLEAKAMLETRGHRFVEFAPPSPDTAWLLELELLCADGGVELDEALKNDVEIAYPNQHLVILKWPIWLRRLFVAIFERSLGKFAEQCLYALKEKKKPHDLNILYRKLLSFRDQFMEAFKECGLDALLGPATPCPALPLDAPRETLTAAAYVGLFNVMNWPAGVMPVSTVSVADEQEIVNYPEDNLAHRTIKHGLDGIHATSTVGLPLAVQIACPMFNEEMVLRLLRELEESSTMQSST